MKEIITTIMCLSFVTGTYQIVVEEHYQHPVFYTGGGLKEWRYDKFVGWTELRNENYVRSILTDKQWNELMQNGIIECDIRRN